MKIKKSLLSILFVLGFVQVFAQAPAKFNYQAVARDNTGNELPNHPLGIRIHVHQVSGSGPIVYTETHTATTSNIGLFNLEIGGGTVLTGNFGAIDWSQGPYFVEVEVDINGGTSYTSMGSQQLLSVPYALFAGNSGTSGADGASFLSGNGVPPGTLGVDGDTYVDLATGATYSNSAGVWSATGNSLMGPAGPNGAAATITLGLVQTGNPGTNVVITNSGVPGAAVFNFTIPRGDTGVIGAQGIPGPQGPPGLLSSGVSAGNTPYWNGTSWVINNSNVFNNGGNVGVGTTTPASKLHVVGSVQASTLAGVGTRMVQTNASGQLVPLAAGNPTDVLLGNGTWGAVPASGWGLTGNAGTNAGTNFIGTTDSVSFVVRANSQQAGRIDLPLQSTFLGMRAGKNNTGLSNTGIGAYCLEINTTGTRNTAVGRSALRQNTTGSYNNALGNFALESNTIGASNVAIGDYSMRNSTTGNYNTSVGSASMLNYVSGNYNCAFGFNVMWNGVIGNENSAFGCGAMSFNNGNDNSAYGYSSLGANSSGNENAAFGSYSLSSNNGGHRNSAFGANAMRNNSSGSGSSAFGFNSLYNNSSGADNSAFGDSSLTSNTTGSDNSAFGNVSLKSNTIGTYNSAFGSKALQKNTTGGENSAVGVLSLISNIGGSQNSAVGTYSLTSNVSGNGNTAVGHYALADNVSGHQNAACGGGSLWNNTIGNHNAGCGEFSLYNNISGSYNVGLGHSADVSSTSFTNANAIGYSSVVNASNKMRLGNSNITVIEGQVAYSFPSDARFKYNIQQNVPGLDFVQSLKPITYQFDSRKFDMHVMQSMPDSIRKMRLEGTDYSESSNIIHTGFLAQDIEATCKKLGYDFDGLHVPTNESDNYSVAYSQFIMPLVKSVQEQQDMIDQLKAAKDQMQAENTMIKKSLLELQAKVDALSE